MNSSIKSQIIGYIPVAGIFIGSRRIYQTLSSGKINKKEILRGSLEIIACGPLLAIIDGIIYSVKAISKWMKKNKEKKKVASIHAQISASKAPSESANLTSKKISVHSMEIPLKSNVIKKEKKENTEKSMSSSSNKEARTLVAEPSATLPESPIIPPKPIVDSEIINDEKPLLETLPAPASETPPSYQATNPKQTSFKEDFDIFINKCTDIYSRYKNKIFSSQ